MDNDKVLLRLMGRSDRMLGFHDAGLDSYSEAYRIGWNESVNLQDAENLGPSFPWQHSGWSNIVGVQIL